MGTIPKPHTPPRPGALAWLILATSLYISAQLTNAAPEGDPTPEVGRVHGRITCTDYPGQSYALYVPRGYPGNRAWPVLYCFDPAAQGSRAVEVFREAAERLGFVVAASNNSRNGSWLRSAAAAEAMLQDTQRRLRIDRRLCFAAGFSGGARVACRVAELGGFAGVIACGAGFSRSEVPPSLRFAFFGTVGRDDFNYQEMRRTEAALADRDVPHRLVFFDGVHQWMPAEVASHALEWLRVEAMRTGALARDDEWLQATYSTRMLSVRALTDKVSAWREYEALAADYKDMLDTTAAAKQAASLAGSREVRRQLAAEDRAAAAEERWLAEFDAAVVALHDPAPPVPPGITGSLWRRSPVGLPGSPAEADANDFADDTMTPGGTWGSEPLNLGPSAEPTEPLRELVRELRRRAPHEAAARRVLSSVFASSMEDGREAMEGRDYARAVRNFTVATIATPDDPRGHYQLACAYAADGRRAEAQGSLDQSIRAGFPDGAAIEALSQALSRKDATVTELEPFVVRDLPMLESSFGLGLVVTADPESRQVLRIMVKEVARNSEAEARGIAPGSVIVSADGRSVQTLTARFTRESEFHQLFMERHEGDTIRLEVITRSGGAPRVVVLTQGHDATAADRPWLARSRLD